MHPTLEDLRLHARAILDAGLTAAAPIPAMHRMLRLDGERLVLGEEEASFDLSIFKRVVAVGAGKAASAMGAALEEILGDRLDGGIIVTKDGHGQALNRLQLMEAAHPVPDLRGLHAAQSVGRLLDGCDIDCLILALISGGASALLSLPAEGLSIDNQAATNDALLRSGEEIGAINAVRKHLSAIKGGVGARRAYPATVCAMLLSDVIGDPPSVIGSGPFAPDPTTFDDALLVLDRSHLLDEIPPSVRAHLDAGARGDRPENPKPDDPMFERVHTRIIASNRDSRAACLKAAESLGYTVLDLGGDQDGAAEQLAGLHVDLAKDIRAGTGPVGTPSCLISGGETTVKVEGPGLGGRNQHLALAAVSQLAGLEGVVLLSAGTDGTDGPTDAAGAWADGTSRRRAVAAGLDPAEAMEAFDSFTFFQSLGDLLVTGPTGTNVMDLQITLVG